MGNGALALRSRKKRRSLPRLAHPYNGIHTHEILPIQDLALTVAEQRADLHDDPSRRALTQPGRGGTARCSMRSGGAARLAQHACANDAPNMRHAVVASELCPAVDAPHDSQNGVQRQHAHERSDSRSAN